MDFRRPSLLKAKDVVHYTKPLYIMVADDDIFFPGEAAVKRAKQLFKNLKEIYFLKNCKHIPHKSHYLEIQQKLEEWLA